MIFFLIFFFQFLMLIYQTIGVRGSGYCGFLTAISQYDNTFSGVLLGLLATLIAVSFAVCAAGNFFLLTQVNFIWTNKNRNKTKKTFRWPKVTLTITLNNWTKFSAHHSMFQIHAIYRSSEKVSFNKAQSEFANEFMRNQGVQRAAATAAQAAVSSQFNNQAQNANRY